MNAILSIRWAKAADIEALDRLERTFSSDRITADNWYYLLEKANADILVAEREGTIVGDAVVLYRRGFHGARLYSLVVDPHERNRGIGSSLLAAAEQAAVKRGCFTMRLEVREDNAAALALYQRHEYVLMGLTKDYYEDHSSALRLRKQLKGEPAHLVEVPFYAQSLDFTCGPAALMMALRSLGYDAAFGRDLELELWREATTIFMLSGHGGCSPYGLAVAALRRGFGATVVSRDAAVPFLDSVRRPEKKDVISLCHERFLEDLQNLGGAVEIQNFTFDDVVARLSRGAIPLLLVSGYRLYGEKQPHWVVVTGYDSSHLYLHDPWIPPGTDRADSLNLPLNAESFEQSSRFGKARHRYMVVLERLAHPTSLAR
ncbi:MAG: GNAT family N-acetyltransferase/peptidase C39 family protein [Trueperaceae bacterium]|nr:MAG: GNAT family N-acetyltransferase/peptidase C39 family protein [Trueperaceae bacterium]